MGTNSSIELGFIFLLTPGLREDYCAETEHTSTGCAILPVNCTVLMFVDSNNHEPNTYNLAASQPYNQ